MGVWVSEFVSRILPLKTYMRVSAFHGSSYIWHVEKHETRLGYDRLVEEDGRCNDARLASLDGLPAENLSSAMVPDDIQEQGESISTPHSRQPQSGICQDASSMT